MVHILIFNISRYSSLADIKDYIGSANIRVIDDFVKDEKVLIIGEKK